MPSSLTTGNSLLAIDVGAASTRAVLFDVIEGEYRFVASGVCAQHCRSAHQGCIGRRAKCRLNLQAVLGRKMLDEARDIITPSQPDGSGVDALVVTLSAGPAIKTIVVGLLKDVSLESARRLAETTYTRLMDTIGLSDLRKPDQQIDSFPAHPPGTGGDRRRHRWRRVALGPKTA
jgi:hypothetical protein